MRTGVFYLRQGRLTFLVHRKLYSHRDGQYNHRHNIRHHQNELRRDAVGLKSGTDRISKTKQQTAQGGKHRIGSAEVHGRNTHESTVVGHILRKLGAVSQRKMLACQADNQACNKDRLLFDRIDLDAGSLGRFFKLSYSPES